MSAFDREATLERRLGAVHRRVTDAEIYSIFSSIVFPIFKRNPYPAHRFGT